jgi:signal transduction histidine kinase
MQSLRDVLHVQLGERIELVTELAPDAGSVKADPLQLERVILNLTANSRDAMPDGGRVTLRTENVEIGEELLRQRPDVRPGPYVRLSVIDTGRGMDEATRGRIFEPFFTTKEQGRGMGLGLATAYGIIKQSKGYIFVESTLGQGTRFDIYLPRARESCERS